ncbi:pilus assembly protein CpaE [Sulfobacillus thermosulfidooxidans DSM 9293]|uniref:Pilus assembly protein CpaE n=1 Tax=Sulfobacillus thermosulfidooxidans (strain DSM 9293 / VKM B-1269 / AT-1) TaxID=929705 RepID=A0A1W1WFP5_SULTA|nr:pilus assembly protein CpaE [Sulfobacillus thermosulfidooxidans DSM 9293]
MFTVYVASQEGLRAKLVGAVKNIPGAVLDGSSTDLRQALDECATENPGVLLIDDELLIQNVGLFEQIASLPYPIVVLASPTDAGAARRALAIKAKDFISLDSWQQDLAAILSRVATPLEGEVHHDGRVIVVFSSKGGVGKTTLSVNLAIALAKASRQPVAIVDLDIQFGDVAPMVGDAPLVTLYDLVKGTTHIEADMVKRALKRVANNVYILAAPNNPEEADDIRADHIVQVLQLLRETHAYVVVDTAPGYTDINVAAFDFSDTILTVCTPDVVTLRTVGQALQVFYDGFHYAKDKVRIVLNRSGSKTGVETTDIAQVLQSAVSYQLPSDGAYPVRAANEGQPLMLQFPESALARAIQNIANDIVQETEGRQRTVAKKPGRLPFFSRLLRKPD